MANIEIRIETICSSCNRSIYVIATKYRCHDRDGSLHTCYPDEDLTFTDCSEYILCRSGDECFSRCKITGKLCDADEAGLVCSLWEEEKEIIQECKSCGIISDTSSQSS